MENKVYHNKCENVMPSFPDKHFKLALVDPPYFKGLGKLGYFGKSSSMIGVSRGEYEIPEWDQDIPDEKYFNELIRISEHQIIWGINYFNFFHCPGRIIWDKCNDGAPFSNAEIASCTFHDSIRMVRYMWNGMIQGKSLSEPNIGQGNKKLNEKRIHPTQKPILLYDWLYKTYLPEGGKVWDSHLGSGSSRIAADRAGNIDFTGCEKNKKVFDDQEKRYNQYKQQLTIFN